MQLISNIIGKIQEELKAKGNIGGPKSQRAETILRLISFMGEDRPKPGEDEDQTKKRIYARIKYWLGRTRKYTPGEIDGKMKQAKDGKNPPALFNWLLKKDNENKKYGQDNKTIR